MNSEWVQTEIRKAHHAELRLPKSLGTSEVFPRQKLFSIRLVSLDRIRDRSGFDADTGKDFAVELREDHIPVFSNWKNHDPFESAFADLLRDLRAQGYREDAGTKPKMARTLDDDTFDNHALICAGAAAGAVGGAIGKRTAAKSFGQRNWRSILATSPTDRMEFDKISPLTNRKLVVFTECSFSSSRSTLCRSFALSPHSSWPCSSPSTASSLRPNRRGRTSC